MKYSPILIFLLGTGLLFSAPVRYVLRDGETLYSLSQKFQIPVELIMNINGIGNERSLPVGMEITIPGVHQVVPGDTIYSLSVRYQVEQEDLMRVNQISRPQDLRVGTYLLIPASSAMNANSNTTDAEIPSIDNPETNDPGIGDSLSPGESTDQQDTQSQRNGNDRNEERLGNPWIEQMVDISGGGFFSNDGLSYDIPLASGNIRTILDGKVVYVGRHRNLGLLLLLEVSENKLMGITGMDEVFIQQGDALSAGDLLGVLGLRGEIKVFAYQGGQPWNVQEAFREWKIYP